MHDTGTSAFAVRASLARRCALPTCAAAPKEKSRERRLLLRSEGAPIRYDAAARQGAAVAADRGDARGPRLAAQGRTGFFRKMSRRLPSPASSTRLSMQE